MVKTRVRRNANAPEAGVPDWDLCLYISGPTTKSVAAFHNLEQICDEPLAGHYHIEVIDLMKNPQIARDAQIVAVPTVVRKLPSPIRRIIGNLSNIGRVISGLEVRSHNPPHLLREREKQVSETIMAGISICCGRVALR
jgi:circadian clock protein KaiB